MLTARYAEYYFGVPCYGIYQSIVRCCIACVQSNNHVGVVVGVISYISTQKLKLTVSQIRGYLIAKVYYVGFKIEPDYFYFQPF